MGKIDIVSFGSLYFNLTIPMLSCSTAKSTTEKTVSDANINFGANLVAGTQVLLKLVKGNSASSPTLNINGSGAKSILGYGSGRPNQYSTANSIMHLVYDGTSWYIVG